MPNNCIVLFQMVGHNPTASDPTFEQWREMSSILKEKNVLVFFDMAYQGLGTGCCEEDAFPLRHFIEEGHKVVFAQSYSKNMVKVDLKNSPSLLKSIFTFRDFIQ